jgi:hypothetical protein
VVDVLDVEVTLLDVDVDVVVGRSEHSKSLHPRRHVPPTAAMLMPRTVVLVVVPGTVLLVAPAIVVLVVPGTVVGVTVPSHMS